MEITDTEVTLSNTLSVGESVHIVDTLYTSNIESTEYINIDATKINIKDILEITDTEVTLSNTLSVGESVHIVDTLYTSNIEST